MTYEWLVKMLDELTDKLGSPTAVAAALGVTTQTLHNWRVRKYEPRMGQLRKLKEVLGK